MQDNEFNEVIVYLDFLLDDVKGIIPDLLQEKIVTKAQEKKDRFFDLVKEQIEQYENRSFKQYQAYPLKDLIARLGSVKNSDMSNLVYNLQDNVKNKFINKIKEL